MNKPTLCYRIDPTKTYTTIYLVDTADYTKYFMSNPSDTALPVQYNEKSTRAEFTELINKLPGVNRIGFIFDTYKLDSKIFLESEPYFTLSDLAENQTKFSKNVELLRTLPSRIQSIDFLCCNTLNNNKWAKYYKLLQNKIIGASNDQTGNINGNWIMENINLDIKSIYFSSGISKYSGTLIAHGPNFDISTASPIELVNDCVLEQIDFDSLNILVDGKLRYFYVTKPIKIKLTGKIHITQPSQCIVIGSHNVKITGSTRSSILIQSSDYSGLIMNGDANERVQTFNNISVEKIRINKLSYGLISQGGWIGQANYGYGATNNKFSRCINQANITNGSSGLIGAYSTCDISHCVNKGTIVINDTFWSGGIIGFGALNCHISKCANRGPINISGTVESSIFSNGGICGSASGSEFIKCSNTGEFNISGSAGGGIWSNGGICGNSTNTKFIKCSNTGAITIYGTGTRAIYSTGGISGSASGSKFIKCVNNGKLSISGVNGLSGEGMFGSSIDSNGGICGNVTNTKLIKCSNTGNLDISGKNNSYGYRMGINGGICGRIETSKLIKCMNTGKLVISGTNADIDSCGGITGQINTSKLIKCTNAGKIVANGTNAEITKIGGICGQLTSSELIKCSNTGNFTLLSTDSGISFANGGICGEVQISELFGCSNIGTLTISTDNISESYYNGGICGNVVSSQFNKCLNTGHITNEANAYNNAGICGHGSEVTITNTVNTGDIIFDATSSGNAGFIGGESSDSTITNSYNLGKIIGNPASNTNAVFIAGIDSCLFMSISNCYSTYGPLVDIILSDNLLLSTSATSEIPGKWNSREASKYLLDGWVRFKHKGKPWKIAL